MTLGVVFALLAAFCFAIASVTQHRAAARVEVARTLHPGLLLELSRQRIWVVSIGADIIGVVLQAVALGLAAVVVIQPTLTSGLLLAVPLSAWLDHRRPSRSDMVGAVLCTAGLAAFLLSAHAQPGKDVLGARQFWPYAGACLIVTVVCVVVAARVGTPVRRSIVLAVSCGFLYGATGPLLRVVATGVHDLPTLLTSWPPYVLAVIGVAGYLLNQNAFQSGELPAPLATLTILDPVIGAAAGLIFLQERISTQPVDVAAMTLAALAVVSGISLLSRRPPGPRVAPVPVGG
jgi:drug/metabolite transporter (DMT)-like permease